MADKKRWMMRLLFGAAAFVAAYFVVYYGDIFNIKREGIFENALRIKVKREGISENAFTLYVKTSFSTHPSPPEMPW